MSSRGDKLRALQARQSQKEEARRITREELLRPRRVEDEIFLPSLGGTVVIRSLSHQERKELQQNAGFGTDDYDEDKLTFTGIVASLVDPKLELSDVEALAKQDYAIIDELGTYITHLNLFGAAEQLKKDSSPTPNSDSDLSSQNGSE